MKNIFFIGDVLEAEKKIISSIGISSQTLMENAGFNSARYILSNLSELISDEIFIITGKGNNAGDGFVIARHLAVAGAQVRVVMLFPEKDLKGDALVNYRILRNIDSHLIGIVILKSVNKLADEIPDDKGILVDAIFGVGFKGAPDKKMKQVFDFINDLQNKFVVSVDVPSGLYDHDQKTALIESDLTLSMAVKKFETVFNKGKISSGIIKVLDIGVSSDEFTAMNVKNIFETDEDDVRDFMPVRGVLSNKYTNGKVFVLTGSPGLTGASYLCCMAALRTGCGAVIAGVPQSVNNILEVKMTEVMTLPLPDTSEGTLALSGYSQIVSKLQWADAVLIGPGLSKNAETAQLVRKIVSENDHNYVIDADAIQAFAGHADLLTGKNVIITPHYGEFAILTGKTTADVKADFYGLSRNFAVKHDVIVDLKNVPTVYTDGNGFYTNSTGSQNLATAGTGDVLSGMITSLYAQTGDGLGSVMAGNYIHGRCSDVLYAKSGSSSMIASDLIDEIASVILSIAGS